MLARKVTLAAVLLIGTGVLPLSGAIALSASILAQANPQGEAEQLMKQGDEQLAANNATAALQLYEQALVIYRQIGDRSSEGNALKSMGNACYSSQDYPKAIEYYQQALAIAKEVKNSDLEARALINLGNAYDKLKQHDRAFSYYQQSLDISQGSKNLVTGKFGINNILLIAQTKEELLNILNRINEFVNIARSQSDRVSEANLLTSAASVCSNLKDYQQAIKYYQLVIAIAQEIKDKKLAENSISDIGTVYYVNQDYEQALKYHQQSLALAREIGDRNREKTALFKIAMDYYKWQKYEKAIEFMQPALTMAQSLKDGSIQQAAWSVLGKSYTQLNQYDRAIEYLQKGLALARELKDRQSEIAALINLGNVYYYLAKYQTALEIYQQALELNPDKEDLGEALNSIGSTYIQQGEDAKAIPYLERSLAIRRETQDLAGELRTITSLAYAGKQQKNPQPYLPYIQQMLALAKQLNKTEEQATALIYLGETYGYLKDYTQAKQFFEQAAVIARNAKYTKSFFSAINNLGNMYYDQQEYIQALDAYQQSIEIARAAQASELEQTALYNQANAYHALDRYLPAIKNLEQSIKIARQIQDRKAEGTSLRSLGNVYHDLGDNQQAAELHAASLAIAKEIGSLHDESAALLELGLDYREAQEYATAIKYFEQVLEIGKKIEYASAKIASNLNLAVLYNILKDRQNTLKHAEATLNLARQEGDRSSEGAILGELGIMYYDLGDYNRSQDYYQQRIAIAKAIGDRVGEARGLSNLGRTLLQTKQLDAAENSLRDSVKIWESLRTGLSDRHQISLFDNQYFTYGWLQEALVVQNKTAEALEVAERSRARAFANLLAQRLDRKSTQGDSIAPLNLTQIKAIAKQQKATIIQYSLIYDDTLKEDGAKSKQSDIYIWAIKPTGEIAFRQVDLSPLRQQNTSLADLVSASRDSLGVRGRGGIEVVAINENSEDKNLQQLHELLIAPIADLLPKNESDRVIFIPQKELFAVPFSALKDAAGKYLIERHTILTAPSIQVLDLTQKQHQRLASATNRAQDTLVVGNPTMPKVTVKIGEPPEQLPSLPGAKQEALEIAKLLKVKALTGSEATKATLLSQLPKAAIIHLATHGLIDDFQGLGIPGAIALAPSQEDSGLLTASEILDLQINANLVVLSACDTGRGRITGDGVVGLSRSLISAGAPSVIVSLWSVPDAPTAALMVEFYRQLQQNSDKAQALRQAMLATMKKHPNPRDWAAFTLIGEAD